MMISIWMVITIFLIHFVCDYVFQTNLQALNKHKDIGKLVEHTLVYTLVWMTILLPIFAIKEVSFINIIWFGLITFVSHTVTDYFTSRRGARLLISARERENYHNYFINLGFDQIFHMVQLLLTWQLLTVWI